MNMRSKLPVLVVLVVLVALFFYPTGNNLSVPVTFVTNRTVLTYSDTLYNYEVIEYPTAGGVSSVPVNQEKMTIGMVVDPWNLNFGIVPSGNNYGTRFIDLQNVKAEDAKVGFRVYGNIAPYVNFTMNDFILHGNENVTVQAHFYAASASVGNYTGQIDVIVQRPKYPFPGFGLK